MTKKGFNHFDIIYYINLEHRTDRKEHVLAELDKTGIDVSKVHRIDAVYMPDFGILGCGKSHIKAMEAFLQTPDDVQNCLILEDDFILKSEIDNLDRFFQMNIEYDVLMISGNVLDCQKTNLPFLNKVYDAQCASGYCITKQYAPKLLENFKESVMLLEAKGYKEHDISCDIYWKKLQKVDKWYAMNPMIAEQMMSYSDIEKKTVYYGC